jgi:hypothetical protein
MDLLAGLFPDRPFGYVRRQEGFGPVVSLVGRPDEEITEDLAFAVCKKLTAISPDSSVVHLGIASRSALVGRMPGGGEHLFIISARGSGFDLRERKLFGTVCELVSRARGTGHAIGPGVATGTTS